MTLAALFTAAAGLMGPFGCSADSGPQSAFGGQPQNGTGGYGTGGVPIATSANGGTAVTTDAGVTGNFTVGHDAQVCKEEGLPVKVPGCSCAPGTADRACWTGPPNMRNVGHCHDGVQHCVGEKEFAAWDQCTGEDHTCEWEEHIDAGEPDSGPPPGYSCIPGKSIGCDEDCETLVICSLTGYKTCQPDGTWGPCHETADILGVVNNVLGCRNWLHGCLVPGAEGFYTGDCSQAYTCGKAPGQP